MKPSAPRDPPRQHQELRGHRLGFIDEGEGPVVLCIHGLPGSVRDWRWLGAALLGTDREPAPGLRLVCLDMPGFGESDPALCPPRVDAYGAFILEAMDALSIDKALVVGHSFGTVQAVAAVDLAPARFSGLGLLAPIGCSPHRGYRRVPTPRLVAASTRLPLLGQGLFGPLLRQAMVRSGFPRSITVADTNRSFQVLGGFSFSEHAARIRRLQVPVLVAWAEDDPMVEAEIARDLARMLPEGPRLASPTGGHNPQKTRAVEIGAALRQMLP